MSRDDEKKREEFAASDCKHEEAYTRESYTGGVFQGAVTYCRECELGFTTPVDPKPAESVSAYDEKSIEEAAYECAKESGFKEFNQIVYFGFEKGARWQHDRTAQYSSRVKELEYTLKCRDLSETDLRKTIGEQRERIAELEVEDGIKYCALEDANRECDTLSKRVEALRVALGKIEAYGGSVGMIAFKALKADEERSKT